MIFRWLTIFIIVLVAYGLYQVISDMGRYVVGASRPIASHIDYGPECCLIPANRGLYRGQQ